MRKMFTTLKSVVAATVIAAMALAASCSYDDSAINERVDRVEKDLAALTERVAALEKKLGEEVDALKKLIEKQTVVTKVEKADDGSTKVTLSDGTSFTVYPKAEAGAEAVDTTIAPNKDTDGTYYWAVFDGGKFQKYLEVDGKKVPVFAAEAEEGESCVCELKFQVSEETGKLLVSIDGGKTWVDSGLAAQQVASTGVFSDVVVNDDNTVTFTLADGDKFSVALAELIECEAARNGVYVPAGEYKDVVITINDAVEDINIMNQPLGWSASIEEYVPEEEDELGGPVIMAAGGKDYVVRINAPAASFADAAKEGVVSVHFNTASGACKVLSINVKLAVLTLDVDKRGNVTIVNSLVEKKGHPMMGYFDGFANFHLGIVYKFDLDDCGSIKKILDYGYPCSMASHDNLTSLFNKEYVVGECEEEVTTFTVEQLIKELASNGYYSDVDTFEYGEDYVLFIAMADKFGEADFNRIQTVDYSALKVAAEKTEDSETWNGAEYKFSFIGYDFAIVGCVDQREMDMAIEMRNCTDLDSFYDFYISNAEQSPAGFPLIGNPLDFTMEPWDGYTIPASQLSQLVGSIKPSTEYRLYALCFNMSDLGNKTFTHEDIYDFGTFTTTGLYAGDFDVVDDYKLDSWVPSAVSATITLSDKVVLSDYEVFYETAMNEEERIAEMLDNAYFQERRTIDIYQHPHDKDVIYVGVIAVNAEGQYSYEEVVLSNIAPIELTAASAEVKSSNGKDYVTITFSNAGGDVILYTIEARDGRTEFLHEKTYSDSFKEDADDSTGCITYVEWPGIAPSPYYMDVKVAADGKYDITLTAINYTTRAEHVAYYKGDIANLGYEGDVELEDSAVATLVTDTNFGGFNPYDVKFTFAAGDNVVLRFNTSGKEYLHLGEWQPNAWQEPHYISQATWNGAYASLTACNVAYENDAYTVTLTLYDSATQSPVVFTYTGAIEGLNAPEACECLTPAVPEQPGGGDGVTTMNVTESSKMPYGSEIEVTFNTQYGVHKLCFIDTTHFNNEIIAAGTYTLGGSGDFTLSTAYTGWDAYNCSTTQFTACTAVVTHVVVEGANKESIKVELTYDGTDYVAEFVLP